MKKIIILLALAFLGSLQTKAQGNNLQFNDVKNISVSGGWNTVYQNAWIQGVTLFTVPVGKVWKIESSAAFNASIYLDGKSFNAFPYWLPSGTHTLSCSPQNQYNSTSCKGSISILEFNIIP